MTESVHDKSNSTSQLITGKSRDLQKSLRCVSGIVTSTFKVDTRGCEGSGSRCEFGSGCGSCGGRGSCSSVVPLIFVLYSIDLPCAALCSIIINTINFISISFHKLPDVIE